MTEDVQETSKVIEVLSPILFPKSIYRLSSPFLINILKQKQFLNYIIMDLWKIFSKKIFKKIFIFIHFFNQILA